MVKLGCGCGVLCGLFAVALCWLVVVMLRSFAEGLSIATERAVDRSVSPFAIFNGIGAAIFPDFLFEFARSVYLFLQYLFTGH